MTRDSALGHLPAATVATITSTIRGLPSEVILDPEDGMEGRCAVSLHNAATVARARLGRRAARLSHERMQEVWVALRLSLGCG